jgi:hypothetical protein
MTQEELRRIIALAERILVFSSRCRLFGRFDKGGEPCR